MLDCDLAFKDYSSDDAFESRISLYSEFDSLLFSLGMLYAAAILIGCWCLVSTGESDLLG